MKVIHRMKVIYKPEIVWAIFQYDCLADTETWLFHSAHYNRERARHFSKAINGKTRVRKILYQVVNNEKSN